MKKLIIVGMLAILAATTYGCASTKEKEARSLMQADLVDQAKAQAATPLFELTCPIQGCVIASLKVSNPAAGAQLADVARVALTPHRSEGAEVFLATMDALKSVGTIGLIAHGVTGIMSTVVRGQVDTASAGLAAVSSTASAGFAANAGIAGLIPQPGAVTITTNTLSGGGVIGAGTNTTTNTTTTNTNTNTNSGNRTCAGAAGGNGAGTTTGGAGGVGGSAAC